MSESDIKEVVRRHYAEVATRRPQSCCGPDAKAPTAERLYTSLELQGLPSEAIAASAGCGNPTALGEIRPGEVVLDLGSGGGLDCFLAAQKVGATGSVIGVDMTPEMLALARKNVRKLGLSNVRFLKGELERLPLEDASVDVIISNCVINLVPDKAVVFREAFRALRPGGRIYITDMVSEGELPSEVRNDPQAWVACIAGAEPRQVYLGKLAAAGFTAIETSPVKVQSNGNAHGVYSLKVKARKPAP